jgi:phage tail tape-measure protein
VDAHHVVAWENGGATDLANMVLVCRHHHRLLHEGGYTAALVDNRPRFFRPDGTPLRPPGAPGTDPTRGSTELRRRHRAAGVTITPRTAEAGSGGAPWWSPQHALDALAG